MDINLNRNSETNDSSGIFIFVFIVIAILFIFFWMSNSPKKNYSKKQENFRHTNAHNMMQNSNMSNTYSEYPMNNINTYSEYPMNNINTYSEYLMNNNKEKSNSNTYLDDLVDVEEINITDDYNTIESSLSNQNNMASEHMPSRHMASEHMPSRHMASEHMPSRHMASEHMPSRHMASEHMPSKHMASEHMPSGNMTNENMPSRHMASEHTETNNLVNNLTNNNNVDISGFLNGDKSCNMSKMQKELVSDYKKKYFNMYKHQIECPKECGLNNKGYNPMQGSCQLGDMKRCNLSENNDCEGIFTSDYNNPDVFSLGFLALDNNNKKSCVTCTSNDNRQTANMKSPSQVINEEDDVEVNKRRLDNRNKFADFNNYIEQNGVMETSVDKLAEIRTCTNGTCGLESFGRKVSDVYDNLLSTTYTTNKKNCNPGMISGVLEDASMTSYLEPLK
jgi:hypothetical protein